MFRKKTGALILAAVMVVCTMTTTAIAAQPPNARLAVNTLQDGVTPYWLNVDIARATISASGSTVKPSASFRAKSSTADIDGTLYLEMKSGGSWTEVDSWSISGTGKLSVSKSYTGAASGTYRSRAVVTVDSEEIEVVSASKTI